MGAPAAFGVVFTPGGLALIDGSGPVEAHKFIQIGALEGFGLEGEVLVGAQVVHPELAGGGLGATGAAIKEEHIGLHALGVEDARGQAQQGVHVARCRARSRQLGH